jgi:hypothetical protein
MYENSTMKSTKTLKSGGLEGLRRGNKRGKFDQSILCAYMEISHLLI